MGNLTVAVLGASEYANNLGKKGTVSDVTLYNLKKGEDTVTLIEPTRYPERLAPLFYAVAMAEKAIVVVDELNATFGECLVMLQCAGLTSGYFVLRNYIPKEKILPLIKGTCLEKFEFAEDNPQVLKERLLIEAAQKTNCEAEGAFGAVPVDHAFGVKGVGTVILGLVAKGTIKKHDALKVLPGTKTVQLRSIQKHDDDFDSACAGDRVGLALKNVEVKEVERGTVLTTDPAVKASKTLDTHATLVKYWQTPLKTGMVLHLGHWMQFLNCKVEAATEEGDWRKPTLKLALEKEIVHYPGDEAVLTYLENGKLRVAGTVTLP
ncbi:elongation factor Tu [Candidatus Bathyarchaeota archaeon]|nr:elongation factor Tu [Candidatus Bathyarchaeota archaeon]